ncbi:MAG: hypothetical protein ACXVJE_19460 [Mucilaginibacter sp.]
MEKPIFKYRINELLDALPLKQHRIAMQIIPVELGKHKNSFNSYRNILIDDKQDIPHDIVDKLEKIFALKPGELQNFSNDHIKAIADRKDDPAELAAKFGMSKI